MGVSRALVGPSRIETITWGQCACGVGFAGERAIAEAAAHFPLCGQAIVVDRLETRTWDVPPAGTEEA